MNHMKIKKHIAIGIIALFIGISISPVMSASSEPQKSMIPIQLMVQRGDGSLGETSISLEAKDVQDFLEFLDELTTMNKRDGILERIQDFFKYRNAKGLQDLFD